MKKLILASILFTAFFIPGCNKSDDSFAFCEGCYLSSWEGYFEGNGEYFIYNSTNGEIYNDIEVQINITNKYDSTLAIEVKAPGYISESFSTSKKNQAYYINIGAGARTLDIGLKKKGNEYKINGTLKLNTYNKVDSTWSVYKSLSFDVYKQ